jgi:hypothetical protein
MVTLLVEEKDAKCLILYLKIFRRFTQMHHTSQFFEIVKTKLKSESHYKVIKQALLLLTSLVTTQVDSWLLLIEGFSSNQNVNN